MEPLRPSPFGQRCKSAKLQRWRCEEAKAKVRRYNGDVRRCETTIASSPSHSRLRNSALSYLRPKGDSAKVEVAPSVHHPSLTFISHRHWSISPVVSTRWLSESVVARPSQKINQNQDPISRWLRVQTAIWRWMKQNYLLYYLQIGGCIISQLSLESRYHGWIHFCQSFFTSSTLGFICT